MLLIIVFRMPILPVLTALPSERSFNIVKATGKKLSQVVDTVRVKDLQPILRKGVLSYLNQQSGNESQTANEEKTGNEGQNENEEQITDAQLNDYLFIENGIIPLPSSSPYRQKTEYILSISNMK